MLRAGIALAFLLVGCGPERRPATIPVAEHVVIAPWLAALRASSAKLTAAGYDVVESTKLVETIGVLIVYPAVNCTGATGATGFLADKLMSPGELAGIVGRTLFVDGRPCVQGYSDVMRMDPGPVIYVKDDTVLPHEFMHVLFFFAYPSRSCEDGTAQWAHVEHGGKCDPLNRQEGK